MLTVALNGAVFRVRLKAWFGHPVFNLVSRDPLPLTLAQCRKGRRARRNRRIHIAPVCPREDPVVPRGQASPGSPVCSSSFSSSVLDLRLVSLTTGSPTCVLSQATENREPKASRSRPAPAHIVYFSHLGIAWSVRYPASQLLLSDASCLPEEPGVTGRWQGMCLLRRRLWAGGSASAPTRDVSSSQPVPTVGPVSARRRTLARRGGCFKRKANGTPLSALPANTADERRVAYPAAAYLLFTSLRPLAFSIAPQYSGYTTCRSSRERQYPDRRRVAYPPYWRANRTRQRETGHDGTNTTTRV